MKKKKPFRPQKEGKISRKLLKLTLDISEREC
jgi:hypothetical protein